MKKKKRIKPFYANRRSSGCSTLLKCFIVISQLTEKRDLTNKNARAGACLFIKLRVYAMFSIFFFP